MFIVNPLTFIVWSVTWKNSPIEELIQTDSQGWDVDRYHITHRKSDIRIWIANGPYFVKITEGNNGREWCPGFIERHRLWAAYKRFIPDAKTIHGNQIKKLALSYLDRLDRLEAPIKD
jgi:hypothetical protein